MSSIYNLFTQFQGVNCAIIPLQFTPDSMKKGDVYTIDEAWKEIDKI